MSFAFADLTTRPLTGVYAGSNEVFEMTDSGITAGGKIVGPVTLVKYI